MAVVSCKQVLAVSFCAALAGPMAVPSAGATASTPFLGEINWVAFTFVPKNWAACNGQLMAINQNQALFSLLGTTYGGDGINTFALPDMRGRAPIHVGSGHYLGERAGNESHTLTLNEMPAHTHLMGVDAHEATMATPDASTSYLAKTSGGTSTYASTATVSLGNAAVTNAGGNQPHENMQPFIALQCIIATSGIFPSQN